MRLYKVIKEQFGEAARYGPEVVAEMRDLSKIELATYVPGAQEGAGDLADPKIRRIGEAERAALHAYVEGLS